MANNSIEVITQTSMQTSRYILLIYAGQRICTAHTYDDLLRSYTENNQLGKDKVDFPREISATEIQRCRGKMSANIIFVAVVGSVQP